MKFKIKDKKIIDYLYDLFSMMINNIEWILAFLLGYCIGYQMYDVTQNEDFIALSEFADCLHEPVENLENVQIFYICSKVYETKQNLKQI